MTAVPYYELAELAEVYLEDSFVLGVSIIPGLVEVRLDVVLREGHPEYRQPKESEQYCFRRSALRFEGVASVEWVMPSGPPAIDASGDSDYGGIDSYQVEGNMHQLVGEIGELKIICKRYRLLLDPDT